MKPQEYRRRARTRRVERPEILYRARLDNGDLVRAIVAAARDAATRPAWSPSVPRHRIGETLHEYVRNRTNYRAENGTQRIRYPSGLVKMRTGDCKSTAVFIAAMAARAGCDAAVRFIRQNGGAHYSHVYAIVDGVPVDPLLNYGVEAPSTGSLTFAL